MIQAGMPPAEVMRVSGHSTLRAFYVYVRADLDTAYRAASALDEFLARSTPVETFDALAHEAQGIGEALGLIN